MTTSRPLLLGYSELQVTADCGTHMFPSPKPDSKGWFKGLCAPAVPFSGACHLCSQGGTQGGEAKEAKTSPEEPICPTARPTHLGALPVAGPAASASREGCNLLPSPTRRARGVEAAALRGSSLPRGGGAGRSHSQTPTGAARSTWRQMGHGSSLKPLCIWG